jgi:hypothetical protein
MTFLKESKRTRLFHPLIKLRIRTDKASISSSSSHSCSCFPILRHHSRGSLCQTRKQVAHSMVATAARRLACLSSLCVTLVMSCFLLGQQNDYAADASLTRSPCFFCISTPSLRCRSYISSSRSLSPLTQIRGTTRGGDLAAAAAMFFLFRYGNQGCHLSYCF